MLQNASGGGSGARREVLAPGASLHSSLSFPAGIRAHSKHQSSRVSARSISTPARKELLSNQKKSPRYPPRAYHSLLGKNSFNPPSKVGALLS
jgi:hypothetical protein